MPIIDIQIIVDRDETLPEDLAAGLANRLGQALGLAPGRLWLRLQTLPSARYAENAAAPALAALPVFVTVMHAQALQGGALQAEVLALTQAIATTLGRPGAQVHIEYAPPGAGRVAFGGTLVH